MNSSPRDGHAEDTRAQLESVGIEEMVERVISVRRCG